MTSDTTNPINTTLDSSGTASAKAVNTSAVDKETAIKQILQQRRNIAIKTTTTTTTTTPTTTTTTTTVPSTITVPSTTTVPTTTTTTDIVDLTTSTSTSTSSVALPLNKKIKIAPTSISSITPTTATTTTTTTTTTNSLATTSTLNPSAPSFTINNNPFSNSAILLNSVTNSTTFGAKTPTNKSNLVLKCGVAGIPNKSGKPIDIFAKDTNEGFKTANKTNYVIDVGNKLKNNSINSIVKKIVKPVSAIPEVIKTPLSGKLYSNINKSVAREEVMEDDDEEEEEEDDDDDDEEDDDDDEDGDDDEDNNSNNNNDDDDDDNDDDEEEEEN
jgi:hypothetical protein